MFKGTRELLKQSRVEGLRFQVGETDIKSLTAFSLEFVVVVLFRVWAYTKGCASGLSRRAL